MTFVKWVRLAHEKMIYQGCEEEFGKAIATYFSIMCARVSDYNSTITTGNLNWILQIINQECNNACMLAL
ncbi:hypothetical protein F7734_38765 [Scytonema sp. UIC 10036]|uniref:hypothetical protein n=1 Tax=Scytonema sp. UIC 10036 TaxID=2304196 RepID=UPI0012DAE71A|nr:hypothetical protein [Scytonema sp. UIC 10036]MUG97934.1 hypothetical protein [Scytonema sp. UIC 10036]